MEHNFDPMSDFDTVELRGPSCAPGIKGEKAYMRKWELARDWIEDQNAHGKFFLTPLVMEEDPGVRLLFHEVLGGTYRDDDKRVKTSSEGLSVAPSVRLRTVDGRPFASRKGDAHIRGYKVGTKAMDSRSVRRLHMQGRSPHIYREFGVEFDVDAGLGMNLLEQYGYRCHPRAMRRRHSAHPINQWILVEVGGPLDDEARRRFQPEQIVEPEPEVKADAEPEVIADAPLTEHVPHESKDAPDSDASPKRSGGILSRRGSKRSRRS